MKYIFKEREINIYNRSHENQQWTDPTNEICQRVCSLILLGASESLLFSRNQSTRRWVIAVHCWGEVLKATGVLGKTEITETPDTLPVVFFSWSFISGDSFPLVNAKAVLQSGAWRCWVLCARLLLRLWDRWWGRSSFDFLCHRAWQGTKWDAWVLKRDRGWQEEKRRQMGGRWGGLGCAKLLPRCPISRCEYIWQIKAKGFVLRKLAAAGSRQQPHQRHPLCFAWGRGVTADTNIFVCVKAYRGDLIMPELM